MSSVAPNKMHKGFNNKLNRMQRMIPAITVTDMEHPMPFAADLSSPSPSFRLRHAAAPSPISRLIEIAMTVIGITTLVAPFPRYPTPCPIKIWSTILYRALTTMEIMLGTANVSISFPTRSVPSGFVFVAVVSISLPPKL